MKTFLSAFFALSLLAAPAYAEHHENHAKDVDLSKEHGEHHTHDVTHEHGDHAHKAAEAKGDAPVDSKDVKKGHDEKKTDDHGHAH